MKFRRGKMCAKQSPGYPTRGLQVWANADYPKDAQRARSYGAVGIGLCRTEHMFFEPERLPIVQDMILSGTSDGTHSRAEQTAPLPAQRLRWSLRGDGRLPGDHPLD
ncbi:MAG: putative PEP-binding protein [Anaerolineales bacterium]